MAGSLTKYAETTDVSIRETGYFERQVPPADDPALSPNIIKNPMFLDAAFALNKGELSSMVDLGQAYAIIFVEDVKAPETKPLEAVRERVEKDYIEDAAQSLAEDSAQNFLTALKEGEGDSWSQEIAGLGATVQETGFLSRSTQNSAAAMGLPPSVIEKGFKLSSAKPYPEMIEQSGNTYYVYKFQERRDPAPELFEEKQEEYETQLLDKKKNELLSAWLEFRRSKAEITTNESLL